MNKIRLLSLFSGIGAYEKAFTELDIPFEVINYCEIDKYASASYSAIHNVSEDLNLWDVKDIDTSKLDDFDMLTFGFPCQSFSQCGKRKGFLDPRGTLFFEAYKIIKAKLPKYFTLENVGGLLTHDNGRTIEVILEYLGGLPYEITMDFINSKDMGIPQNRNRLYCFGRRVNL